MGIPYLRTPMLFSLATLSGTAILCCGSDGASPAPGPSAPSQDATAQDAVGCPRCPGSGDADSSTEPLDAAPPPSEFPNSKNTGVPPGTQLTPRSSKNCDWVVTTDGTTIDAVDLAGCIDIEASRVTIRNSHIRSDTWWAIKYGASNPKVTGLTVTHTTIDSAPGKGPDNGGYDYAISQQTDAAGTMEIAYDDISGYKDGVDATSGSIHDNYIHDLSFFSGAHTQNIYVWAGGTGLVVRHNTLINQTPAANATAAIYIAPDSGHQNGITVDDNWLAGGSLAFYGGDTTATNIAFTNNRFSTAIFPDCGSNGTDGYWQANNAGNRWSGNVWADGPNAGKAVDP